MKTRNSYKCVLLLRSEGATGSKYDALKCMQDAASGMSKERVERLVKIYPTGRIIFRDSVKNI